MRHDTCAGTALIFAALALPACALATDGDVDTTFGVGGFAFMEGVDAPTPGIPRPLVQPDGKIVFCTSLLAAGSGLDFFIMRLDPDGSFDTTFNFDGKVTIISTAAPTSATTSRSRTTARSSRWAPRTGSTRSRRPSSRPCG